MNHKNLKYTLGIVLIIIVDGLHNLFFENDNKYDVYLFYNNQRFLTNILFDISNLFRFSILTYWLIPINKRIFKPLFYLSILIWGSYFLTYNQITSLFILPIYFLIVIHFNLVKIKKQLFKFKWVIKLTKFKKQILKWVKKS